MKKDLCITKKHYNFYRCIYNYVGMFSIVFIRHTKKS